MFAFALRPIIAAVLLSAASLATPLATAQISDQEQAMSLNVGDVIVERDDKGWNTVKIIALDTWPDGSIVAHSMVYVSAPERPNLAQTASMQTTIMHAPIDAAAFATGWELLGNLPVSKADQEGFVVYLKHTDFPRYISFTDQKVEDIVGAANSHYKRAIALGESGDHEGAIAAYGRAIDIFPLFFEAIDNQAFSYMDLGQYETAAEIFAESLQVNPDGVTAFFSRGECFLRLGRLDEAAAIFEEGQKRFPEERALFAQFAAKTQAARQQ